MVSALTDAASRSPIVTLIALGSLLVMSVGLNTHRVDSRIHKAFQLARPWRDHAIVSDAGRRSARVLSG